MMREIIGPTIGIKFISANQPLFPRSCQRLACKAKSTQLAITPMAIKKEYKGQSVSFMTYFRKPPKPALRMLTMTVAHQNAGRGARPLKENKLPNELFFVVSPVCVSA